jgi:GTP-binding protein LepA
MNKVPTNQIRNFALIAHIDHGKSTIADRMIESTKTVDSRNMQDQLLDNMDIERERGITIKARPVVMKYKKDDVEYHINMIDTPGHVDFSYEVSRSLAACEGALLIVDASQGIQAQTLANLYLAIERDLIIIPVLNKIDLPTSDPESVKLQITEVLGIDGDTALPCSGKTGEGIETLLSHIIDQVPAPIEKDNTLCALIFDSHYDQYRGVYIYIRVISGSIKKKDKVKFKSTTEVFDVSYVGVFCPNETPVDELTAGMVGFFCANVKETKDVSVGDTVVLAIDHKTKALDGFEKVKPVLFSGIYPVDANDYDSLRDATQRLQLNDSSFHVESESSQALGLGFRCGFLGLLHLEIIIERLSREYGLDIITTSPSVIYKFVMRSGEEVFVDNTLHYPDPSRVERVEEPIAEVHVFTPATYMGAVYSLVNEKRGQVISSDTVDQMRVMLTFEIPMNEIITDFNDKIKLLTKGYASFDYELKRYQASQIVKLEIKINGEPVDSFSQLVPKMKAEHVGRQLCKKLKNLIPAQLFKVPIQAFIGGKIVARETISAKSKNVTAKCYGGDITRKQKLWKKQAAGKKKMQEIGKVKIPSKVYMEMFKSQGDD